MVKANQVWVGENGEYTVNSVRKGEERITSSNRLGGLFTTHYYEGKMVEAYCENPLDGEFTSRFGEQRFNRIYMPLPRFLEQFKRK